MFAGRLQQALQARDFHIEQDSIRITASFGVTVLGDHDDLDRLLKRADTALYAAKGKGRDRVVALKPDDDTHPRRAV